MDRHYAMKLLREASENPHLLTLREKFWKLDLFPHYLRRCCDLVYRCPPEGLVFSRPAPQFSAKIAEANPGANGADLMLLGHTYLGSAYRHVDDHDSAEEAFREAGKYKDGASPKALTEHLRRLAYLRMYQGRPECFPIVSEAIEIHKRGSLVNRHELGECLLCRGHAYFEFRQPGKSLEESLKLPIEVGMVLIDLAMLYLIQGRIERISPLIEQCTATFRRFSVDVKVQEALDLWHQAQEYTPDVLLTIRDVFANHAEAMPQNVAA